MCSWCGHWQISTLLPQYYWHVIRLFKLILLHMTRTIKNTVLEVKVISTINKHIINMEWPQNKPVWNLRVLWWQVVILWLSDNDIMLTGINVFEEYVAFIFRVQSTTLSTQVYIPEYTVSWIKGPHMKLNSIFTYSEVMAFLHLPLCPFWTLHSG
jgi:hypothetical protein